MTFKFDDLNDKQRRFVDLYLDLGDRDEAYRKAGYSIEGRGWKANARKLFMKFEGVIEDRIETRIGGDTILALSIVKKLMTSAKSESIQLKAADRYLELGGRNRVREVRHIHTKEQEMTDEQLDKEIESLSGGVIVSGPKTLQ